MHKLLLLIWGVFSVTAQAETITGKVIGVADGDTFTMLVEVTPVKIRVAGIDSPEKAQDFGQKAKQSLSALAFGKIASAHCIKKDKYQRNVCTVIVENKDIGLEQIQSGMAWWYRQYSHDQSPNQRSDYEIAETSAKLNKIGLWFDDSPTPPWDWRKQKKTGKTKR